MLDRKLIKSIREIQKSILIDITQFIADLENKLAKEIGGIFLNYKVKYDAKPEQDLDKSISFFKANTGMYIGPENGHLSSIEHQGVR